MGERWKDNSPEWNRDRKPHPSDLLYEVFTEGLGNFVSGTDNEIRREQFIRAHNADCAAYEKRIAELEATVARVKAESLRVVGVKSENEINFGAFVRHIFLDGKFVRLEYWEDQG